MDPLLLLFIKITLSSAMVTGITLIAERGSPRLAGVIMGFPLGAGLALFFLGFEQGTGFAAHSALWSIPGTLSMLSFCLGYRQCSTIVSGKSIFIIILCTISGLICYFLTSLILQRFLPEETWARIAVLLFFVPIYALLLGKKPPAPVSLAPPSVATKKRVLLARAGFASAIIIIVTASANTVGPVWSGLFSTFPTTILPSVLILHRKHGAILVPLLFRETTFGMLAIVVFAIAVHFFFPIYGVYLGALLSYIVAFIYLLTYERYLRRPLMKTLNYAYSSGVQKP